MALVNPKLNLNKTPSIVDNNSLVFAKNIRLEVDSTIRRDYGILPMSLVDSPNKNNAEFIDYNNIGIRIYYQFKKDIDSGIIEDSDETITSIYTEIINSLKYLIDKDIKFVRPDNKKLLDNISAKCNIVGVIPNSNEFFLCMNLELQAGNLAENKVEYIYNTSFIVRYDEAEDRFEACDCNWTYSSGKINGCVVNNLRGEKILIIAESEANKDVPLKCINLNKSSFGV